MDYIDKVHIESFSPNNTRVELDSSSPNSYKLGPSEEETLPRN